MGFELLEDVFCEDVMEQFVEFCLEILGFVFDMKFWGLGQILCEEFECWFGMMFGCFVFLKFLYLFLDNMVVMFVILD